MDTVRGPKGGYCIAKSFDELTLGEIVHAVEGDLAPVPCLKENGVCEFDVDFCVAKNIWGKVFFVVNSVLGAETLFSLLQKYEAMIQKNKQVIEYFI